MASPSDPFARTGSSGRAKYILLGSPEISRKMSADRERSLQLEHVSPRTLKGAEISRRPGSPAAEEAARLALMRRWFFARKPDAGFLLTEFPATLLQALVLDEWLEARDESLTAVAAGEGADANVVAHYRTLGLFLEAGLPAA